MAKDAKKVPDPYKAQLPPLLEITLRLDVVLVFFELRFLYGFITCLLLVTLNMILEEKCRRKIRTFKEDLLMIEAFSILNGIVLAGAFMIREKVITFSSGDFSINYRAALTSILLAAWWWLIILLWRLYALSVDRFVQGKRMKCKNKEIDD